MNEQFTVELRALGSDDRPAEIRLRRFQKLALRLFGLRCVTMQEIRPVTS